MLVATHKPSIFIQSTELIIGVFLLLVTTLDILDLRCLLDKVRYITLILLNFTSVTNFQKTLKSDKRINIGNYVPKIINILGNGY